jgi:putative ABC transport system permease protein
MRPAALVWNAAVFGPLLRSPGRTALTVGVIALGVALGFAVYLINRSAADEVSRAARSLFGLADFAIEANVGALDEHLYPQVARVPGIAAVSPVVEVNAKIADRRGTLKVVGIDAFRSRQLQPSVANLAPKPGRSTDTSIGSAALFLSASAARDLERQAGDTLDLQVGMRREQFVVAGVLPAIALEDRAALLDIAVAQWKFDALGTLTRINVRLAAGARASDVRGRLQALLPANARIVTPGEATDDALRLSSAYRSNLTALALVALFTGSFLVYSTQTLAVLRRRRELALLHALGVTHREQRVHTIVEAALIGGLGAIGGVALGLIAARYALQVAGADLGAGYFRGLAPQVDVSLLELASFVLLGVAASIVGAVRPAVEATRISTATSLKAGDAAHGERRSHGWAALCVAIGGALLLLLPPLGDLPLAGYAAIALIILAAIIGVPALLNRLLRPVPTVRHVPTELALAHLRESGRYASLSVAAIVVSFSLMVAMLIMVTSFRSSLDAWTEKILPADLYLRVGYIEQTAYLDAEQVAALTAVPGVARTVSARFSQTQLGADPMPVVVVARDIDAANIEDEIWLERRATNAADDAIPVWISEAAADRLRLAPGDAIELRLGTNPGGGRGRASIRGIWRDYEHQAGALLIDRREYVRLTGDRAINAVSFWLAEGAALDAVQQGVRNLLRDEVQYDLRTPSELRRLSLQVFDRTFAVTYVLEIVAIVIGLFGISASISAQVLARRGEFGVLRHLGVTRGQVAQMLASEGVVLGVLGVIVGLASGAIVAMILIYVVNRQSFHWSMDVFVPAPALALCSAILIVAAAAIAVVSGRNAMGDDVVRAVKEDW